MEESTKKRIEELINLVGKSFESLDYALEQIVKTIGNSPDTDQIAIKDSIILIADHMEAISKEVKLAISPDTR